MNCTVPNCTRSSHARTWCRMHYYRWKRTGDPGEVSPRKAPRGSGHLGTDGYIRVRDGGKALAAHRIIMSQHLGRELLPGENVHHLNGVRSDNRLENLEVWVSTQPAGQRIPDLRAWAYEILTRYGSEEGDMFGTWVYADGQWVMSMEDESS